MSALALVVSDPGSENIEQIFTDVYNTHLWTGEHSRSGEGSSVAAAGHVIRELPGVLAFAGARSVLDIPCGDFTWMNAVNLGDIDYLGGDIVQVLIADNQARYGAPHRRFARLDLTTDLLPRADVVLCRDCFLHLPLALIFRALTAIAASGAEWLLASHYSWRAAPNNEDCASIHLSGRRINLEIAPFNFPPPLRSIAEAPPLERAADKQLALWRVRDVAAALRRR